MTHFVAVCGISLYLVVTVLQLAQLWRPTKAGRRWRLSSLAFIVAFILHTVTLLLVVRDPQMRALENGADYFLWVSWAIAAVYLGFRRWFDYPLMGAFITPAVVLFMGSSSYLLHQGASSLIGPNVATPAGDATPSGLAVSLLHGVPALVAVVSVVLALAVSVVFLIVERRLKRRSSLSLESGGLNLELLDRLNSHLVKIGFVALSLVIVSGGLWAVMRREAIFSLDTSVVSGLVLWALLAAILFARLVLAWSPKRLSRLTVFVTGGFILSVFLVLIVAGRMTHASLWS
jgi:ABC-type uncharacterized transport system permease subunit